MVTVLDDNEIKEEICIYLRNQDIFTIAQRGVTTTTQSATYAATTSVLINRTNVKNIRSITVAGSALTFGTDYTVDYDFLDTTIKCKVSFVAAQTGAGIITYDYGTDKIYPDRPRLDLTISQFPRISIDIIGDDTKDADLPGDMEQTTLSFSITVFDKKSDDIDTYLKSIKTAMLGNKKSFYYLTYVRRVNRGPLLPYLLSKGKVDMRSMDYISPFNFETTT